MDKNSAKIHVIPEDTQETKEFKSNPNYYGVDVESNTMQLHQGLKSKDSGKIQKVEGRSDASNLFQGGSTIENLMQQLQTYSKSMCVAGGTLLGQEAIQLRERLVSYRKKEKLKNDFNSSKLHNDNSSVTLESEQKVVVNKTPDKQFYNEKVRGNQSSLGYDTTFLSHLSNNSFDKLAQQTGLQSEGSPGCLSDVSPPSNRLMNFNCNDNARLESGRQTICRYDAVSLNNRRKRDQSTVLSSTSNEKNKNGEEDHEGESVRLPKIEEGDYLCQRAKRMKRMANLLIQIERLHVSFIMQVMDCMTDDQRSKDE